jgi:hypothetical protein
MSSANSSSLPVMSNYSLRQLNKRPRLERQIGDEHQMFFILFEKGYDRFCTCCCDCSYMKNISEACDRGGDSGKGYVRYFNNIIFVNFV